MSDHPSQVIMPGLLAKLARTAPGLACELVPVSRRAVYDLDLGEIDVIVMPEEHADDIFRSGNISSTRLFEDEFVCVVDEGETLSGGVLSVERHASMPHIALRTEDGSRSLLDESWRAAGLSPRVSVRVGSFVEMIGLLPGTPLVATVHRRLAERF